MPADLPDLPPPSCTRDWNVPQGFFPARAAPLSHSWQQSCSGGPAQTLDPLSCGSEGRAHAQGGNPSEPPAGNGVMGCDRNLPWLEGLPVCQGWTDRMSMVGT